jgi:hypothetical protein
MATTEFLEKPRYERRTMGHAMLFLVCAVGLLFAVPAAAEVVDVAVVVRTPAATQVAADAKVLVSIKNLGSTVVRFGTQDICALTTLVVKNADGVVQKPGSSRTCVWRTGGTLVFSEIPPGVTFSGFDDSPKGVKIIDWGYALTPGTYSVQVILNRLYVVPEPVSSGYWKGSAPPAPAPTPVLSSIPVSNVVTLTLK